MVLTMVQLSQIATPESPDRSSPATPPGQVLAIVCAGVILASLDLFIVNIALPDIARDFGTTDVAELSWVLNGYAIVYASLLVFFGRLADRHRRDHGFLLGVAVFTAASAACAASTSVGMLVAFRLVQAAGAALLTPTSLGLVLASYPPEGRSGAVRTWTAIGGVSAALGPVIGGLLVAASWRWVFLVNVPVGLAALVVGWRRLPHVPGHPVRRPDAVGAILVTGGVGPAHLRAGQGRSLGMGIARPPSACWPWPPCCSACSSGTAHGPTTRSSIPALFRVRTFSGASLVAAAVLGRRSAPCCCRSCCGNRTPGAGRRSRRDWPSPPGP